MSPAASSALRVGLVGCGRIAATYLEALEGVAEYRLVGVVDVDEEAARRVAAGDGAARPAVRAHADYRSLLGSDPVEAVIVCTPPSTHAEIAGYFLDHGCHVLCEKPLAVTSQDAERLVKKAARAGRLLMMASKFRYVDDVLEARRIIGSGTLGEVILYENVFCSRIDMRGRWNANRSLGGGGVLIDNGSHSVDIARFLLGPIVEVRAEEGERVQDLEVEDTCRLGFRTAGGAMGSIDLSWSIQKERESYIEVFGREGTLSVGWRGSKYRRGDEQDWTPFGSGYHKVAAFARQLQNFAGAARGVEEPLITPDDSLESVRVIEIAYRSMARKETLPVAGPGGREPAQPDAVIHPTAMIEEDVSIGRGSRIWDHAHVRHGTTIGEECIVGEKSYIACGVSIGSRVKINAFVAICTGVTIENGVMIGAGTVFTNDRTPRATTPDLRRLRASEPDEDTRLTRVREGATLGAGSTIGCDLSIGRFAMVGMGSVVTRDVADFHLVAGNPARSVGCVCRCGQVLARFHPELPLPGSVSCTACARGYEIEGDQGAHRVTERDPAVG